MYFFLTEALTRKFIEELRRYWKYHPKYQDLVGNIQGKYSFKERPQRGIVVKVGGGTHVSLSPDNYKGIVYSHTHIAKVRNKPGVAVEWVREDSVAIQNNSGTFPSPPGIYYIDLVEEGGKTVFYVDPLLDVYHEQVLMVDATTAQLQQSPLTGTLRLFEMPSRFMLVEGTNYTVTLDDAGKPTGEILLTQEVGNGRWLQADYRYVAQSTGPHEVVEMHANNRAIPGVVMAFGRRVEVGDQLAVVVESTRSPAALEYGGRWEMSMDFEVFARDVFDEREIADQSVTYLFGVLRSRLSSEGIEITNISLGGEAEEPYDENGDDYFYTASFSLTVETEWSLHYPLSTFLRQVTPLTLEQAQALAGMDDETAAQQESNIRAMESLGLETVQDPYWSGRTGTFEIIR